MKTPTAAVNFNTSKPLQKRTELSIKSKSAENQTKASFRTSLFALKMSGGTFKFQAFTPKYRTIFLKYLNLYVWPVSRIFIWNILTMMWNLDLKLLCGIFTRKLYVKLLSGTFMTNLFAKRLCGTFVWNIGNLNHSVELFSGTLEPLFVEPGNL